MLFNSLEFAIFLPVVFILYWFVVHKNLKLQNLLIVVASYFFYGWWDARFLILILFSTVLDYLVGLYLHKEENPFRRKLLLVVSVCANLGLLGFFKYFNFFISNFSAAFTFFGYPLHLGTLSIILPVGISFYTFQSLSYTIDVYRKKIEPTKDFITFAAFISFFPQLFAGPIERAAHLLPQFINKRVFKYQNAVDGLRQILWGVFKKVVIADASAYYVNMIFANIPGYSGSTLLVGIILFSFQIYGDFSGYTDITLGVARLFGFDLMKNFSFPYFSRDIAEFWRRWHISLSTWFRDYVYIPLGGSKGNLIQKVRNVLIIFLLSGFWHGAKWTFLVWGALNALYFLPLLISKNNRKNIDTIAEGKLFPSLRDIFAVVTTFSLVTFSWIFFRAESISDAVKYIRTIFSSSTFSVPEVFPLSLFIVIIFFFIVEWLGRTHNYAIEKVATKLPRIAEIAFYYFLIFIIFAFWGSSQQFIYFQF